MSGCCVEDLRRGWSPGREQMTLKLLSRWQALYIECLKAGDYLQAGICAEQIRLLWPLAKRAA